MKQNVKRLEDIQAIKMLVKWMNEDMVNEVRILNIFSQLGLPFEDWDDIGNILDYQMLISDFVDWIELTQSSEKGNLADYVSEVWRKKPEHINEDYILDQLKLEQLYRLKEIADKRLKMFQLELEKLEKRKKELEVEL